MPDLAVAHACILSLALLTPFTLSPSVDVFYAFRMIQTALMGQYVLLHPKGNSKLQALLNGTPFQCIFFCTSWDDLKVSLNCFKHSHAVFFPIFSHCQFPTDVLFGIHVVICSGPRTFPVPEVFTSAAEQIRLGRSSSEILV